MLIDDAIGMFADIVPKFAKHAGTERSRIYEDYLASLNDAAAYALDVDTAVFLESLSPDMRTGATTLADTPLPHRTIFVEYPFKEVGAERHRQGGPMPGPDEVVPRKLGILLRHVGGHVFASILAPGESSPTNTPFVELDINALTPEGLPITGMRKLFADRDIDEALFQGLFDDVMSEIPLILTFLLFLNNPDAETIRQEEVVPPAKLDANRIRSGKQPLKCYRRVKLGRYGRMHLDAIEQEDEARRGGVRAHFVRGHYMRSHGKLVWRRPHIRGGKEDGSVPDPVRAEVSL